jgi:hypothetical protein
MFFLHLHSTAQVLHFIAQKQPDYVKTNQCGSLPAVVQVTVFIELEV